jgi:phosphoribulokinase
MLSIAASTVGFTPGMSLAGSAVRAPVVQMGAESPVVVGIAADSGCGKSTFMRRLTSIFGGEAKLNDIGRETNTLVSDMTTVICLDDYHKWDRTGRK